MKKRDELLKAILHFNIPNVSKYKHQYVKNILADVYNYGSIEMMKILCTSIHIKTYMNEPIDEWSDNIMDYIIQGGIIQLDKARVLWPYYCQYAIDSYKWYSPIGVILERLYSDIYYNYKSDYSVRKHKGTLGFIFNYIEYYCKQKEIHKEYLEQIHFVKEKKCRQKMLNENISKENKLLFEYYEKLINVIKQFSNFT